jgi:K+-sensing histidine kinase KdpD
MWKPEIPSRGAISAVLRYGLAVVSVAVALGLALLAQVYAIPNLEFPLFLTAIAVTVWYAGAGPGVLAVLFSGLGFDYFLTEPLYTLYIEPPNRPLFVVFILFAFMIGWFSFRRRRIEQELRQALNELDTAAQRTQQAHLLNLTHDTIFVRDMSDVITYWNRGAEERYGGGRRQGVSSAHANDFPRTA